jgi:hypothetical protein
VGVPERLTQSVGVPERFLWLSRNGSRNGSLDSYRRLTEAITTGDELGASAIATCHAQWSLVRICGAAEP